MKDLPIKAILVPLFALIILFVLMLIVLSRWIIGSQGDTATTTDAVTSEVMADEIDQSGDLQSDRISRVGGGSEPTAITSSDDAGTEDLISSTDAATDMAEGEDAMAEGDAAMAEDAMADGEDAMAEGDDSHSDAAMSDDSVADDSMVDADAGEDVMVDEAMVDSAESTETTTAAAASDSSVTAQTAAQLQNSVKSEGNGQSAGVPSAIIGLADGGDSGNAAPPAEGQNLIVSTGSTGGNAGGTSTGGSATDGATSGEAATDGSATDSGAANSGATDSGATSGTDTSTATGGTDATGSNTGATGTDGNTGTDGGNWSVVDQPTDNGGAAAGGSNGTGGAATTGGTSTDGSNIGTNAGGAIGNGGDDSDNDGVVDSLDNCANTINADQRNMDGDAVGDVCDSDMDGDGIANAIDNCSTIPNGEQGDLDGDGIGDVCEAIGGISFGTASGDRDGDTILDGIDNCVFTVNPKQADSDGDGVGDMCDADVDGDGFANAVDNCVVLSNPGQEDDNSNGIGVICESGTGNDDGDADGILDGDDNCVYIPNPDQNDMDADGLGDACDFDLDADDRNNAIDNCVWTANSDQADADKNGVGDACETAMSDTDRDNDGFADEADNCADIANAIQQDLDSDGIGDACDDDVDGDSVANFQDNCMVTANGDQADADSNGVGDACESADGSGAGASDIDEDAILNSEDNCALVANAGQQDMDGDGVGDACDNDIDGDEVPNRIDNCVNVANADQLDSDGDGFGDVCAEDALLDGGNAGDNGEEMTEGDSDGDTVANDADNCVFVANLNQKDSDSDGIGDVCDNDIDGDGVANAADNCVTTPNIGQIDTDNDGVGDVCEAGSATDNGDAAADEGDDSAVITGIDDQDGIPFESDNCPFIDNVDQTDLDGDGVGDACDGDVDGDNVANGADNCVAVPNANQADSDGDGIGNVCETGGNADNTDGTSGTSGDSIYTPPPTSEDGTTPPIVSTGETSGATTPAETEDASDSEDASESSNATTTSESTATTTTTASGEAAEATAETDASTTTTLSLSAGEGDADNRPNENAATETRQSSYGENESDDDEPRALAAPFTIYKNTLPKGWEDRSWDANVNFSGFPAYDGLTAMTINFKESDGAVYLYSPKAINIESYNLLRFFINGGVIGGQQINVALVDENENVLQEIPLSPPYADNWRQIDILLEDLGNPAAIHGLMFTDALGEPQSVFFVDEVSFVDDPLASKFNSTEADGPGIMVYTTQIVHDISPLIYGMNWAPETIAREIALPLNRWGGNAVTRYNYLTDSTNTGNNWYFENIPPSKDNPQLPNNSSADKFVQANIRTETETLMTLPLLGWVATDEYTCGFNVEKYGEQVETDEEWRPECGGGVLVDGTEIEVGDPTDTSIPAGPGFVQGWINHLNTRFGAASEEDGVTFYNLDNEPMIWSHTHRDIIADDTLDTDTFIERTKTIASAAKAADPSAQLVGPVFWGWTSFFWSDVDVRDDNDPKISAPDREAHGGDPLAVTYLKEMAAYEAETGTRLLDYFDLHFYPQASGVAFNEVGGESIQALRLRSTRALWDPSYVDESWIGEPVYLIPRMHEWVDEHYPETKLAITEYNWGGLEHINGAIAQADVLGIFGRENVHMAALWGPPEKKDPGMFTFRMYRNYDGKGAQFGDRSIVAESENEDQLSVFAAKSSESGKTTIIVINKATIPFNSNVTLDGMGDGSANVFRYSKANLGAIERMVPQTFEDGQFLGTFPPNSITLYEIE